VYVKVRLNGPKIVFYLA